MASASAAPEDEALLFSRLRELRKALAAQGGVPAYCVCTDETLNSICRVRPSNLVELRAIKGVGDKFVSSYSAQFLDALGWPVGSTARTDGCEGINEMIRQKECRARMRTRRRENQGTSTGGHTGNAAVASALAASSASRPPQGYGFHSISIGGGGDSSICTTSSFPAASVAASAAARPPSAPAISALNLGQKAAYLRALAGANLFITGEAGTGKSYLLRSVIAGLEEKHPGALAATAPTGIAASHINGTTIHSWAGIGLGKGTPEALAEKVSKNSGACARWRAAKTLVVDEISMLDASLFSALDLIGRTVRGGCRPFGGLQVIACGDFFQLPPVSLKFSGFAFQSPAWSASSMATCNLTEVVRQSGDGPFLSLLNEVRRGRLSVASSATLASCHVAKKPLPRDGIAPTRLYCTNRDVDSENAAHLAALPGGEEVFVSGQSWKRAPVDAAGEKAFAEAMEKKAPGKLRLKVGAQVLLTRNWAERSLVNGSRGIVVGFETTILSGGGGISYGVGSGCYPGVVVRFDTGAVVTLGPTSTFLASRDGVGARIQLPLKLAWALTVHKSQGMTLTRAELVLEDAFAEGQVYVALSRVVNLKGLWVSGGAITQAAVKAHPAVLAFYNFA
jgi:ATP-dependent DNA helicase PIF1